jgi:basic amino acid/polyamine antiporter, APA family
MNRPGSVLRQSLPKTYLGPVKPDLTARPELVRSLGRWSLAALVLNGIIGSGVFVLPGTVGASLGWSSLWAWCIAAIFAGAIIFSFAEVASRFSGSGGAYLFTEATFGPFVGLQIGWLSYFVRCISGAVQANLFSTYLGEFLPWAGTRTGGMVTTAVFIGMLAIVNIRSVISGARLSNVFAVLKVVPLLLLGAVGILWIVSGKSVDAVVPGAVGIGGWLQNLLLLMFALGGFESAVIPLAEAKDPGRDGPFALITGIALVTFIYILVQITVLVTLTDPDASNRPLADSMRVVLGDGGAAMISIVALLSVYGWLASNMLAVPRLSMAMAERGDFPAVLARVHPTRRTPWVSVIVYAMAMWFLANQAGLLQNISLSAVSRLFVYGSVCACLPVLRRRDRTGDAAVPAPRFLAPGGMALAGIGLGASVLLAARMNMREAISMALLIGLATVHWLVTRRNRARDSLRVDLPGG